MASRLLSGIPVSPPCVVLALLTAEPEPLSDGARVEAPSRHRPGERATLAHPPPESPVTVVFTHPSHAASPSVAAVTASGTGDTANLSRGRFTGALLNPRRRKSPASHS